MNIQQCHFSSALSLFKKDFFERWNLIEYSNPFNPALFVGIYNQKDLKAFNDHLGFRLVLFGGADIPNVHYLVGDFTVVMDEVTFQHSAQYSPFIGNDKRVRVAFKNFDRFQPVPLGKKIYCYQAGQTEVHKSKYRFNILEEIIKFFGRDNIIVGYQGHNMNYVQEVFYKESFIGVQLNPLAGFTTTLEMAHMGRPSISNYKAPFCLSFNHIDDIINTIKLKMEMRGKKIVESLVPKGFFFEGSEWLETEFWK